MTSDTDLVQLTTSRTAIEAEWIVGALKGMGIVAVTFGDQLADEFAMSQQLMGLSGGVRVMVQRGQLEAAREALETIQQDRPSEQDLEEALAQAGGTAETDEPPTREARSAGSSATTAVIVILGLAVAALGWLSISQHLELTGYELSRQPVRVQGPTDRRESRWSDSGELAFVYLDLDKSGVWEEVWVYDQAGRLYEKRYDENENRFWEVRASTTKFGAELYRLVDANENGVPEKKVYAPVHGVEERWIDADEDGRYERREYVDLASGAVRHAFEDRGQDGFVSAD